MVPSKTTPAAEKTGPIQGHVVGPRSAMRVPRNNGEKRRLKKGINGSVATIGASQSETISFSRRRLGLLSMAHDKPACSCLQQLLSITSWRKTALSEKWPAEMEASPSSSDLRRTLHFGFHRARNLRATCAAISLKECERIPRA